MTARPDYISYSEALFLFGIGEKKLDEWIEKGKLIWFKADKGKNVKRRFRYSDVEKLVTKVRGRKKCKK